MGVDESYGPLGVAVQGRVWTVTIDHPPSHLVDGGFLGGLIGLLGALDADASARVVVFRSADPDFFLMHGDVDAILGMPVGAHVPATEPNIAASTFQRLTASPVVSIGVVDGAARGGGCEFLTALDLRVGSPRTVIGQPEVAMGILPGAGGTTRWPHIVGRARALDIVLTGRDVDADEALAIGWLQAVVPSAEIDAHADALARRIAAMPAASVAAVKQVVDLTLRDQAAALTAETDALGRLTASAAHHEPMRRFLAAGGQTREGETTRMAEIMATMLDLDG
jgi:enoyl-CoA hydratase/carnithine racemase